MRVRLAMVSAAFVAAMASAAVAQPDRVDTSVFVSDAGVDFSSPASTATFYASLEKAAFKACESGMGARNLTVAAQDRQCAAGALDRAVKQAGVTSLLALHSQKTGRPVPATLLASQ